MSSSPIYDSQDSTKAESVIVGYNFNEASDISFDVNALSDDADQDVEADDQILKFINKSLNKDNKAKPVQINKNSVTVKEFDLGNEFDPDIVETIDAVKKVTAQLHSTIETVDPQTSDFKRNQLSLTNLLKTRCNAETLEAYIQKVTRDTITGRYLDWHYIDQSIDGETNGQLDSFVYSTSFLCASNDWYEKKKLTLSRYTLRELLLQFGVSDDKLQNETVNITKNYNYDNLCEIYSFESLLSLLQYYVEEPSFDRHFLLLILDRKVYESQVYENSWCQKIIGDLGLKLLNQYLQHVDENDYFMHYRFSRVAPILRDALISNLLNRKEFDKTTKIVNEFNRLFDDGKYKQVLYFVFLVLGSSIAPWDNSVLKLVEYFTSCVSNLQVESATNVELLILKNVLGIYTKTIHDK